MRIKELIWYLRVKMLQRESLEVVETEAYDPIRKIWCD